jgi:protein phosphatase
MNLNILTAARTETGRRPANEDSYTIDPGNGLYVVADGTASRGGGKVAADIACQTVRETLQQQAAALQQDPGDGLAEILRQAVVTANNHIQERQATDPDLQRMATTLVMALYRGRTLHMAYVGDSRIYLYRNGELTQLTRDHSLENYLKDNPHLKPTVQRPGKTLLSALGLKKSQLRIDYLRQSVERDDLYILCSDGLHDAVPGWILREILAGAYIDTLEQTADCLVRAALSHGGMDNISVILLHASELSQAPLESGTVIFEPEAVPSALASSRKVLGWLTFTEGPRQGELLTLDQRVTIGASGNCTLVLAGDEFVSSRHAEIQLTEFGFVLRDLDSTNGTFLNNKRIRQENLVDGDTVRIGTTPLLFKDFKF